MVVNCVLRQNVLLQNTIDEYKKNDFYLGFFSKIPHENVTRKNIYIHIQNISITIVQARNRFTHYTQHKTDRKLLLSKSQTQKKKTTER